MKLTVYKKTLFSWQTVKKLFSSFLQAFGALALLLGMLDIFFPNKFNFGYQGIEMLSGASFFWGIFTVIPRWKISRNLLVPDVNITIKVGDLFEENGNLVIGMTDVFDTEKGNIIKPSSIQGQFLSKIYNDDRTRLDKDIKNALQGVSGQRDTDKRKGKNIRYPIGTVVTVVGSKKYFCSAYSRMGNDLKAQSDINKLSTSLTMLWDEIRLKGQKEKISMGVLGSDLARIGTASHSNLIKLIVSSFILASREIPIAKELVIVIHENNLEKVNMLELNDFLQNF